MAYSAGFLSLKADIFSKHADKKTFKGVKSEQFNWSERSKRKESELGITEPAVESVWADVDTGGERILIGCVYRPVDSEQRVNKQINKGISRARSLVNSNKFGTFLIAGDFSFHDIEWPECSLIPGPELDFREMFEDNFITQNVKI